MKKKIVILIFVSGICHAQELQFQQEQYPFPLTFYGVEPQLGFTASSAYYYHDFGDLDNDGDWDIIIGSSYDSQYYFENIGSQNNPQYILISDQMIEPLTTAGLSQPPCFCDIDNDNDLDVFLGCAYRVVFYENIGSPDTSIFIIADSSFTSISNYYCQPTLDFVDIDADGDFDLFLGFDWSASNGRLHLYRNIGTPEVPIMDLESDYFEEIDIGSESSPEFCDIDNDNDFDLFIGCNDGTVWYFENIGDSVSYDFQYVTDTYFNIDVGNMSVPRFCDIDADGDFDLFVANESNGNSLGFVGDMDYYENVGTSSNADFRFITGQYLFMDMNAKSSPYAADIDNDGLLELMVGAIGGNIVYFENEGTVNEPILVYTDSAYQDLWLTYQPIFSLKDIDSDDDLDMVVRRAGFDTYVDLYENIGTPELPEYSFLANIVTNSDWSQAGLDFCDIDGDNDFDIFFGDGRNRILYYENIGDSSNPRYQFINDNYLNQPYDVSYLYPRFNDIDHDGDFDIIMGSYTNDSYITLWRNIGDQFNTSFVAEDTLFYWEYPPALHPRPCFGDIDGDGDDDMFVGESGGAMLFYRNLENPYQAQLTITIQDNDVILTWGSIADAVEYQIFYRDIPYFTPSGIPQAIVLPPDTVWMDEGVLLVDPKRFYRMITEY